MQLIERLRHNLRGYDSHLIFNGLDKFDVKIRVLPNGLEKYMAFFLNKNCIDLEFIDSMQFMNSSLHKLVKNMSDEDFKYLVEEFGSENLELLKQKGAYPYKYMNSLLENIFMPLQRMEKLVMMVIISDGHISVKDYLTCQMKYMGDYHNHYLKKDVLLFADVFEKFMVTCLKFYGLDPCHYFSRPGLSWNAMLKMTGIKLEKISDIDKYLFIEKGLRGEIPYIAERYAKQITNI